MLSTLPFAWFQHIVELYNVQLFLNQLFKNFYHAEKTKQFQYMYLNNLHTRQDNDLIL